MRLRKVISILCSFAIIAGTLFCLTACGPSNEEIIRQSLTEEFDAYKNLDDDVMTAISTNIANQGLDRLGIDTEEFVSVALDGFDYSIGDINVDGKHATADMTFVGKSFLQFQDDMTALLQTITDDETLMSMNMDERLTYLGGVIMETFKEVPVVTENVTIEYELKNNVWESTNSDEIFADIDNIVLAQGSLS